MRAPIPRHARHVPDWAILALACIAQFMVILDVSIVNVALPSIRSSLGFSATGLQWVVNAYTLTFAGFLLLGGRAADLFGRRRIFMLGLALFAGASLLGGFAQSQTMLIVARSIQGFGGAILSPATLTILTTTYAEGPRRAKALGVWSAMAAAGGATGSLAGGVLTDLLSWRWIFFVNVPIGIAALVAARALLTESRGEPEHRTLDIAGAVTVTASLVVLVYGIVRTDVYAWTSWQTLSAIGISAVLLAAFLYIETRRAKAPLMPLGLFRSRSVTGANLVMLAIGGAIFAMWYFLSLYMQNVLGFSPLVAGLGFLPQTVAIALGAAISSRLVSRSGPRPLLLFSSLLAAAGLLWMSQLSSTGTYLVDVLGPGVLVAFALGIASPTVTLAATSGVATQMAGLASGLVNTTRQIGGAIGLAALATLAADRTKAVIAHSLSTGVHPTHALAKSALTSGFGRGFVAAAGIALFGAAASLVVPPLRARSDREGAPSEAEIVEVEPVGAG